MYLDRPHLRFDGLYVSRNTYIRPGITEWKVRNPVHLVCYFRYLRFLPDGTLIYRTSPETVSKVARSMLAPKKVSLRPSGSSRAASESSLQEGRYRLVGGGDLYTAVRYSNSTATEVRSQLRLRSTVRGANNRLDIRSIVSYDREDGRSVPMVTGPEEGEGAAGEEGVERKVYSRGMAPYVFVPWEQVNTSILNLPVSEMDVFIAG